MQKYFPAIVKVLAIFVVGYLFLAIGGSVARPLTKIIYPRGLFVVGALFSGLASGCLTALILRRNGRFLAPVLAAILIAFSWFVRGDQIVSYEYVYKNGEAVPVPGHQDEIMYSALIGRLVITMAGSVLAYFITRSIANDRRA